MVVILKSVEIEKDPGQNHSFYIENTQRVFSEHPGKLKLGVEYERAVDFLSGKNGLCSDEIIGEMILANNVAPDSSRKKDGKKTEEQLQLSVGQAKLFFMTFLCTTTEKNTTVNAFSLYKLYSGKKLSFNEFKQLIITQFLEDQRKSDWKDLRSLYSETTRVVFDNTLFGSSHHKLVSFGKNRMKCSICDHQKKTTKLICDYCSSKKSPIYVHEDYLARHIDNCKLENIKKQDV